MRCRVVVPPLTGWIWAPTRAKEGPVPVGSHPAFQDQPVRIGHDNSRNHRQLSQLAVATRAAYLSSHVIMNRGQNRHYCFLE